MYIIYIYVYISALDEHSQGDSRGYELLMTPSIDHLQITDVDITIGSGYFYVNRTVYIGHLRSSLNTTERTLTVLCLSAQWML